MPETLKIDGKMNVHIFSATRTILDGVADKILLPAIDGDIMILYNRAPLFTSTRAGIMWVYNKGQRPEAFYIEQGIAEIRRNICSVIAWGMRASDIDKAAIHKQRLKEENNLPKVHSAVQRKALQERIDFFKMLENKPSLLVAPDFE